MDRMSIGVRSLGMRLKLMTSEEKRNFIANSQWTSYKTEKRSARGDARYSCIAEKQGSWKETEENGATSLRRTSILTPNIPERLLLNNIKDIVDFDLIMVV